MNSWRKFFAFISLMLSGVAASQAAAEGGTGLLGRDLTSARAESDYFQFFCLEQVGFTESLAEGGQRFSFKPSGSDFRQLVTIHIETDSKGAISALRAVLARSFVDDTKNGVFARDLIKSTLLAAASQDDVSSLKELSDEILYRGVKRTVLIGNQPHISTNPSAAYLVVAGSNSEWQSTLVSSTIKLTNETQDGCPSLVVEIRAKGA